MLTGDICIQTDRLWDSFWLGGISNPLEVTEHRTYCLVLQRLDELQQLEENETILLGTPFQRTTQPILAEAFRGELV